MANQLRDRTQSALVSVSLALVRHVRDLEVARVVPFARGLGTHKTTLTQHIHASRTADRQADR